MKKLLAATILVLTYFISSAQTPFKGSDYQFYYQVNIGKTNGTLTTHSAWLEVGKDSTNKGLRIPRVVDTANISSPIFGLIIYQIKDNGMYFRDKVSWKRIIDPGILNLYLRQADSTIFYPYWSNPRGYLSVETDPIANAKTVRWIAGTGINVSNGAAQALSTNPVATISAQNTTAIWNANKIQGVTVSATAPTTGQVLQYNGTQYIPSTPPPSGTVNSVGLSMPSIFNVSGSPVTNTGTLTATLANQLANLVFASPNGVSGMPSFRSLAYPDFPLSGVASGIYGSDTTIPKITVNSQGIITSAVNIPISIPDITGTPNRLPKYNATGDGLINSQLFDNGTNVGINNTSPIYKLDINGNLKATSTGEFGVAISINGSANTAANFATVQFKNNNGLRRGYVGDASSQNQDIYLSALNGSNIRLFGIVDDTITTAPTLKALFSNNGKYVFNDTVITGTAIFRVNGSAQADSLSIGLATPSERLHVNGNIIASAPAYSSGGITTLGRNNTTGRFEIFTPPTTNNVTNVNDADYTVTSTDDIIIFSNTITANRTVTLPSASANTGRFLYLVNLEMSGSFTYSPSPSILLNSGAIITGLGNNSSSTIFSDGTNWRLLDESTH